MTNVDSRRIKLLASAQIITGAAAIVALVLAIASFNAKAGEIHSSRLGSARDSCQLLRGLVYAATTHAQRQRAAAAAYIALTPLRDCDTYARDIVK